MNPSTPIALVLAALALAPGSPRALGRPAGEPVLLTLDGAIALALDQNRLLKNAALEIGKSEDELSALRTRRLPKLQLDVLESRLLDPVDLTIAAGSLGTLPQLGGFPPKDTKLRIPADFNTFVRASVSQPLSQQYRIGLGIEVRELGREVAQQALRRERQRITAEVRTAYYGLAATQSGIEAAQALVRALREMDQLTQQYLGEQVVLRADGLEVKARLAREEYRLLTGENALLTQHEHLNELLGRDIQTSFRVVDPFELTKGYTPPDLEEARRHAFTQRAEIQEAQLRARQAEAAVRLAHADWIPDLSFTFQYLAIANSKVLPDHVADVGLALSWEPFDWGRRNREAAERSRTAEQAHQGATEASEQIGVEVGLRWRKVQEQAKLLDATRLAVGAAQESLQIVMRRYREESRVLRDVLQSQAQLSSADHDYSDALASYWSAVADLKRALGDE